MRSDFGQLEIFASSHPWVCADASRGLSPYCSRPPCSQQTRPSRWRRRCPASSHAPLGVSRPRARRGQNTRARPGHGSDRGARGQQPSRAAAGLRLHFQRQLRAIGHRICRAFSRACASPGSFKAAVRASLGLEHRLSLGGDRQDGKEGWGQVPFCQGGGRGRLP